jgi:hypothetical protein
VSDRLLPKPPPPSSPGGARKLSAESDFWAGLFLDLSLRVEWLEQALDAVPREDASAEALVRLRSYARALAELHQALAAVQARRADPDLKPLFHLEGPLAGFLSRLYGWCEEIGADFERMAGCLRRKEPTSIVFSHAAVNRSYADFEQFFTAMRRAQDSQRAPRADPATPARRAFEECVEELIWATEWVHMTLARTPGA